MVLTSNGNYATSDYVQDAILNSEDMKKLFVTKIPKDANDDELKSFLESMSGGTITSFAVIRKETARNHFAFVSFETSAMVDEVIYREKDLVFNNSTLEVNRACPKQHYQTGAHHKTTKLFITGIPKTGITEEELKDYFDSRHDPKYGMIESLQFVKKKDESGAATTECRGFGFAIVSSEHFADTMSIQHAAIQFKGHKLELKKSDRDGQPGQGQRGGRGGGGRGGQRGGQHGYQGGNYNNNSGYGSGYGGYGGYGAGGYDQSSWGYGSYGNSGYNNGGYNNSYGSYPQYGVSSAARGGGGGGRGGKDTRGGRGKRFTPYAKTT